MSKKITRWLSKQGIVVNTTYGACWQVCKSSIDPDQLNDYFRLLSEQEGQATSPEARVEENYREIRCRVGGSTVNQKLLGMSMNRVIEH